MTCFDVSARHLGALQSILLPNTMFHTPLCYTPSFTHNFVTRHLSHTTLSHTSFSLSHTIFHVTYHFVTHNSSHTTFFTSRSSTASFVFPSFPVPSTTFVAHYWKRLTCGVVRSFKNCVFILGLLQDTVACSWWTR